MQSIELVYWPIRGLSQPIINLLEHLHLPYTVRRVASREEWQSEKEGLVAKGFLFANLPYIRDGDLYLAESTAIHRYLCKKAGKHELLPTAAEEDKFNELAGAVSDFRMLTAMSFYTTKSHSELIEALKCVLSTRLASKVEAFHTLLGRGEFLFGKLTFLDFIQTELLEALLTMQEELEADVLPHKDTFEQYVKRVTSLPGVAEYRESPKFQARPFSTPGMTAWH